MSENSGDHRTPRNDHELTNEELREKLRKMGKKMNSPEKRSEKMKQWKQKYNLLEKKMKKIDVTPVRLDFESDEQEEEEKK